MKQSAFVNPHGRSRVVSPILAATASAAILAGASAAPAQAAPAHTGRPDGGVRTSVAHAVRTSPLLGAVAGGHVTVSRVRVSHDGRWASASVSTAGRRTDPAQVVLSRSRGAGWVARDLGTSGVGCSLVPARLRTQLGLHGPC